MTAGFLRRRAQRRVSIFFDFEAGQHENGRQVDERARKEMLEELSGLSSAFLLPDKVLVEVTSSF